MHEVLLPSNWLIRLRNSYRHPEQASLAARIPVIRRRVPLRSYWARRSPHLARTSVVPQIPVARAISHRLPAPATVRARLAAERPRFRQAALDERVRLAIVCITAGGLAMYYLDPQQGRRRRALTRDRVAHVRHLVLRDVPHTVERRGRFLRGKARGLGHQAVTLARMNGRHGHVDDETLVDRVRSEALRHAGVAPGRVNVDAYEGCVTLRGQLDDAEEMRRLIDATKRVDGVREICSYLHLPGTLPPNKAESYDAIPEQMRYY